MGILTWFILISGFIGLGYPLFTIFYLRDIIKKTLGGFLPDSISCTYYLNEEKWPKLKEKSWHIANPFRWWCWGTSFSLLIPLVYFSGWDNTALLLVGIAISGLLFVGLFPDFYKNQHIQHFIGAGVCALAAIIWIVRMLCIFGWGIILGYTLVALVVFLINDKKTKYKRVGILYLLEMVALASLYTTLFVL